MLPGEGQQYIFRNAPIGLFFAFQYGIFLPGGTNNEYRREEYSRRVFTKG